MSQPLSRYFQGFLGFSNCRLFTSPIMFSRKPYLTSHVTSKWNISEKNKQTNAPKEKREDSQKSNSQPVSKKPNEKLSLSLSLSRNGVPYLCRVFLLKPPSGEG